MTIAARVLAGILAAVAIGVCGPGLLDAALPFHRRAGIRRGLILFVGLSLGLSLWAAVGLAAFFARMSSLPDLMGGDAILALAGGAAMLAWRRARKTDSVPVVEIDPADDISSLMICFLLLMIVGSAAVFALQVRQRPDGGYDAWAIWNLRARFIYARSSHTFDAAFPHADYSPLWPALLARIGWLAGGLSTAAPMVCGALAATFTAGILFFGVAWFRGARAGVVAAIMLLGTQELIDHAADQYADVPLASVFLATGVLLALFLESRSTSRLRMAFLAGLLGGAGALVKNEGMIYVVALLIGLAVAAAKFRRPGGVIEIGAFVAGAVPMLLLLGVFRFGFAPANDMLSGGAAFAVAHDIDSLPAADDSPHRLGASGDSSAGAPRSLARRLTDSRRYRTVLFAVLGRLIRIDRWNIFLLAAAVSFVLRPLSKQDAVARAALGTAILLTCGGYFMAYVATPHGLEWHINTSMNRLILQIWGVLLFLTSLRLNGPPAPVD
ncbi:MAG TPA: glycosyltransferase family 39 protein [Tepidisphaeraceae bacterium]|nr:glycosyltransferase family 39 protein [Tepidisphaeraceae bacterium]